MPLLVPNIEYTVIQRTIDGRVGREGVERAGCQRCTDCRVIQPLVKIGPVFAVTVGATDLEIEIAGKIEACTIDQVVCFAFAILDVLG